MRIITDGKDLSSLIIKLINYHSRFSFAVAWASGKVDVLKAIYKNKDKVRSSVIGTHFYQTDPDVLNLFINFDQIHFILQPSGVFHPKSYIFWSKNSWDIIIGSANMTNGAFSINKEISFHISSNDVENKKSLADNLYTTIKSMWAEGFKVDKNIYINYLNRYKIENITKKYNYANKKFIPTSSQIMSMPWDEYYDRIIHDPIHNFEGLCEILKVANELFSSRPFREMDIDERKAIAGLNHNYNNLDWRWFGGMTGAGKFHQRININDIHISQALDLIPLNTPIQYSDYDDFINEFKLAFPEGGAGVGVASRLLAMKRPDYFVCYNKGNKHKLCDDLGITQLKPDDYRRYWDDIIVKILDSVWWNSKPSRELSAWKYRTALLDAIFYEDK